jgi:hypothetical protein
MCLHHPRRLHMFHAAFLRLVARPDGQSVGEVMYRMDSLYGRPGAGGCCWGSGVQGSRRLAGRLMGHFGHLCLAGGPSISSCSWRQLLL